MEKLYVALTLLVLATSCKKDVTIPSGDSKILSFSISYVKDDGLPGESISCNINDTAIDAITGSNENRTKMIASFNTFKAKVSVNGVNQVSGITVNDFSNAVTYTVTAENGDMKKYVVKIRAFTGLPVIYLSTKLPVTSKELYVDGTMRIDGNFDYIDGLYNGVIQIRGRGNSTWYQEKKPYKIKLPQKTTILGMPADKEWALLANYFDKTLLRNDVAFELSERVGLAWTPRRRFVELYMNDEYMGSYLLTETVKTSVDRLNIPLMDVKNNSDTSGGYLVEADHYLDGDQWFITASNVGIVLKEPDPVSTVQLKAIFTQFEKLENDITNYVDIRTQIDLDSWIKWVIVNEIMRNRDGNLHGSCFFYRSNNKLFMGPVWDFDLSSGAYADNIPSGWYISTSNWIGGLFDYHPYYKARFKEIWNLNYKSLEAIRGYISQQARSLQYSQQQNFSRWDIINESGYDGQLIFGTYQNETDNLSNFISARIQWINEQVNSW